MQIDGSLPSDRIASRGKDSEKIASNSIVVQTLRPNVQVWIWHESLSLLCKLLFLLFPLGTADTRLLESKAVVVTGRKVSPQYLEAGNSDAQYASVSSL